MRPLPDLFQGAGALSATGGWHQTRPVWRCQKKWELTWVWYPKAIARMLLNRGLSRKPFRNFYCLFRGSFLWVENEETVICGAGILPHSL